MDFKTRLERVEENYKVKYFDDSCFTNYTDEQLMKYISDSIEKFHKEHNIKSYSDAQKYYNSIASIGAISKEENRIHIQMEREYFNGDYDISQVA